MGPVLEYSLRFLGCIGGGIGLAIGLTVIVGLIAAVVGPEALQREYGPLGQVIRRYFKGGVIGGALVGLLHPLSRWRLGTIVLGWIGAGFLYQTVLGAFVGQVGSWDAFDFLYLAIMSVGVGTVGGNKLWKEMQANREAAGRLP